MTRFLRQLGGVVAVILGVSITACGENGLSSGTSFSGLDGAAAAAATVPSNSIASELLMLADDVDTAVATEQLPSERPRPRIDRVIEELGLSDDQVTAFESIVENARLLRDPIWQQVRDGTMPREEARSQLRAIRDDTRAQVEAILTTDQQEVFSELREHHGRQFNQRSLSDVLNLTDGQQTQVEAVLYGHRDKLMAIREQVESDGITREEARRLIQAEYESELEALSAILDEEQLANFQKLLRHGQFGFGPRGFGHGPRGTNHPPGPG